MQMKWTMLVALVSACPRYEGYSMTVAGGRRGRSLYCGAEGQL